jgi:hypothetical protein
MRLLENIFKPDSSFGMTFTFQGWSSCQLKMVNVQGNQAPAKQQKMLKKFENSSEKMVAKQFMNSQTLLESVMEFARS